jgi:hypothetical protein
MLQTTARPVGCFQRYIKIYHFENEKSGSRFSQNGRKFAS